MGTSKSYNASVKGQPQWGSLSKAITISCNGGKVASSNLERILGNYVKTIGGASRAGKGISKIGGKSSLNTAKNISTFIGDVVSSKDLESVLHQLGLSNLENKTVSDIINHLIEYCSGPATRIDNSAAKEASRQLFEEILEDAKTIEDMQERLRAVIDKNDLEEMMIKYFAYYIHEHLSIMFYEKLVRKKGRSSFGNLFRQIKEFIKRRLEKYHKNSSLNNIQWGTEKTNLLLERIQTDVLKVFEHYED